MTYMTNSRNKKTMAITMTIFKVAECSMYVQDNRWISIFEKHGLENLNVIGAIRSKPLVYVLPVSVLDY